MPIRRGAMSAATCMRARACRGARAASKPHHAARAPARRCAARAAEAEAAPAADQEQGSKGTSRRPQGPEKKLSFDDLTEGTIIPGVGEECGPCVLTAECGRSRRDESDIAGADTRVTWSHMMRRALRSGKVARARPSALKNSAGGAAGGCSAYRPGGVSASLAPVRRARVVRPRVARGRSWHRLGVRWSGKGGAACARRGAACCFWKGTPLSFFALFPVLTRPWPRSASLALCLARWTQ